MIIPEEQRKRSHVKNKNNHRLISVIPVVAKVFERIFYDQLHAYLSENNVIAVQ